MSYQSCNGEEPMNNSNNNSSSASSPKSKKVSWTTSCVVTFALVANMLLLVAILVAVLGVKSRVLETVERVDKIVSRVESGHPSQGMLDFTNVMLSSAAEYFVLGDFNGQIVGFINDLLEYDFAGFANDFKTLATRVAAAFSNSQSSTDQAVLTGANAVQSVASKIAAFTNVNGPAASDPAMSDGVFRLDHIMSFVRAQANATAWKASATTCTTFLNNVNQLSWYGSFVDANGNQQTWDFRNAINTIVTNVQPVCNRLANL